MSQLRDERPILLVPYVWIGDFVRCHSVVKVLKERFPHRPVDIVSSTLCAPMADYMPGVRKAIVHDIPRRRLAYKENAELAAKLKPEHYGTSLIMSRKWKAALPSYLAGIPERVGFAGEMRYGVLTDVRYGEKKLPRMIDQCAALALPKGAKLPKDWPLPEIVVPKEEIAAWRARVGLQDSGRLIVALCPGAVGPGKRWPELRYAELAKKLTGEGCDVWVVGGPGEKQYAQVISANGRFARDLTSNDLRNGILQLAAVNVAVSNDSGLMHIAAAVAHARVPDRVPIMDVAKLIAGAKIVCGVDTGFLHIAAALGVPVVAVFTITKSHTASPTGPGPVEMVGAANGLPETRDVIAAIDKII
jgi:heptosyltransferase-2